jgi:hypothetical protein
MTRQRVAKDRPALLALSPAGRLPERLTGSVDEIVTLPQQHSIYPP